MISHGYAPTGWREHPRYRWLLSRAAAFPVAPIRNVTFRDLEGETFDQKLAEASVLGSGDALIRLAGTGKQRAPLNRVPNALATATVLAPYRSEDDLVALVNGAGTLITEVATFDQLSSGPETFAYLLHRIGAAGVAASHNDWTKGFVALFHRFEIPCWATDVLVERECDRCDAIGIDVVVVG